MGSLRVTVCAGVLAAAALTPTTYAAYAGDAGKTASVAVTPATAAPGTDITLRVTGCAQRTAVAASPAFVADARLTVADAVRELAGESRVRSTLTPGTYPVRVVCGDTERTGTLTVRTNDRPSAPGTGGAPPASGTGEVPPASGTGGFPPASGTGGFPPASGTGGFPPASGIGEVPPASGTGGIPPTPGTGGPLPVPGGDGRSAAPDPGHEGEEQGAFGHRPGAPASPVAPVRAGGGGAADLVAAEERGTGPGTAQGVTGLVLAGVAAVVVALGGARRSRGTD
ncbi:hypothetical protein GCM10010423_36770 [Streptomyces levis]|uniref:Uncharacterized protein n=1 Tax=Streptomyces levis TaxID=285566 RepID=A0ABP6B410_9ACTN